ALALSGRLAPDAGRLRVAGHLLPGRAAWVRAHVGAVIVTDAGGTASALSEALRGCTPLVVIDGLDRLGDAERDQVAALLRDAPPTTALLLTSPHPPLPSRPTPPTVIDLDAPSAPPRPTAAASPGGGVDAEVGRRPEESTTTEVTA
ncbi:MAG: hypothetical protein QM568_08170, partial [Microbacterium sp.]